MGQQVKRKRLDLRARRERESARKEDLAVLEFRTAFQHLNLFYQTRLQEQEAEQQGRTAGVGEQQQRLGGGRGGIVGRLWRRCVVRGIML